MAWDEKKSQIAGAAGYIVVYHGIYTRSSLRNKTIISAVQVLSLTQGFSYSNLKIYFKLQVGKITQELSV